MPEKLEAHKAYQRIRDFDSQAIEDAREFRGEVTIYIRAPRLRAICEFLRDVPDLNFRYLSDVTAVDLHPAEPRFEVVYHLRSLAPHVKLCLKVRLPGDNPRIDSLVPVWPGANAFEREVWDLMGIQFDGHPFLRRILLPEDWEGHPLRKDFPTTGYR
ncbi:MAG: NADH-quinone oxidoreductase subunit C [Acidobacteria bacterium]|nr:NADH-quinone oxidoreductase subunit C [Acidobacteriota bacterium]